jgi:hypothetical protein
MERVLYKSDQIGNRQSKIGNGTDSQPRSFIDLGSPETYSVVNAT